jgi:hypothetical protein
MKVKKTLEVERVPEYSPPPRITPPVFKQFGGSCIATSQCAKGLVCSDGKCARPQ